MARSEGFCRAGSSGTDEERRIMGRHAKEAECAEKYLRSDQADCGAYKTCTDSIPYRSE